MCGRFALTSTPEQTADFLGVASIEAFPPRYNIAPTQPVLTVVGTDRAGPGSNLPQRKALLTRWGLIPGWVKDPRDFPLLINARCETVIDKASFRAAMRHRRVLIPVSGFYEWHRPGKESNRKSQPYWIRPRRGGLVAFAGLMEAWSSADGSEMDTSAIVTCGANHSIGRIHDRMPVVIQPEDFDRWLDCKTQEPREVADLMRPADDDFFEEIPVSDLVNKVANVGPELQFPVSGARSEIPDHKPDTGNGQLSLF